MQLRWSWCVRLFAPALACMLAPGGPAQAQTYTELPFDSADGAYPYAGLIQATDGRLYGTASEGGAFERGAVFGMTPGGALTALYSFCAKTGCADGARPIGGLLQGADGAFYGTTSAGGAAGLGTVFRLTLGGSLKTLYSFDDTHGANPDAGLIQGSNGALYGTTSGGGAHSYGTVFRIDAGGLITLHSFEGADGADPYAALLESSTGEFYGTTLDGGANGYGTVFKITAAGKLTSLHSFDNTDGAHPYAGLIQASDGKLYGTTFEGGALGYGAIFSITKAGAFAPFYTFDYADGAHPYGGLVLGTDGNFYGTTLGGGTLEYGIVFMLTPSGTLTTLHGDCSQFLCADGTQTDGALLQATNGTFYGTTRLGGASNDEEVDLGTVFSISVGLGPFVELQNSSGKIGSTVRILGSDLSAATGVTFNGAAAQFTVVSAAEVTAIVPAGATSGSVLVATPSGTLDSNASFIVQP